MSLNCRVLQDIIKTLKKSKTGEYESKALGEKMEETNNRYKLTSSASYFFILPNKLDLRFSLSYHSSLKEHFSSFKFPQNGIIVTSQNWRETMSFYNHKEIEPKWQGYWAEHHTFKTGTDASKPKFYALDMFPYPSGAGLHVGHPEGYTATDILSRYKRAQGYNVLHPMGWDAFGLPAEQYAMDTGNDPAEFTAENIANFKRQINALGFSYDWDREVNTTDPNYYKWTQWIFTKLYEKGLAYEAEVPVNWVEELGTAIANEEVLPDGTSERGGYPVVRKPMRQWMLKITAYAERLLNDLDDLDWPESIKDMQRNWIGKSTGANVTFKVKEQKRNLQSLLLVRTPFSVRPSLFWRLSMN